MRDSESIYLDIRGLRYHVRRWAHPGAPKMVLLHGWMDVSASFQFMVDALRRQWDVYAPDWRGYGLTGWTGADSYWFPDYIADLDSLLDRIQPQEPANLVGHSLGGNAAALYAGIRPERVAKLVNLEGFGLPRAPSQKAPERYARWLDALRERPRLRAYANFGELEERLRAGNPRLTVERAQFLARHWGRQEEDGSVVLRGDPKHKIPNPVLYRYEEARACWQGVTAPVLWIDGAESEVPKRMSLDATELAERRGAFRELRYLAIPGAGHMLHHDQPDAVAAAIEEFLAPP